MQLLFMYFIADFFTGNKKPGGNIFTRTTNPLERLETHKGSFGSISAFRDSPCLHCLSHNKGLYQDPTNGHIDGLP
jgi:hypothetical protein